MFRHILPNAMVATLTFLPFILTGAITGLTSLDFLGFGLPSGSPSLGELIAQGKATGEIRDDLDLDLFAPYILSGLNRAPEWANIEHMKIEHVVDMVVETTMNGISPKPHR